MSKTEYRFVDCPSCHAAGTVKVNLLHLKAECKSCNMKFDYRLSEEERASASHIELDFDCAEDNYSDRRFYSAEYFQKRPIWKTVTAPGIRINPYKKRTKARVVFSIFAEKPRTIEECFIKIRDLGYDPKIFLLVVYEVLNLCISSNLFREDEKGKIGLPEMF